MYKLTGVTKRYTRGKETVEALRGIDLVIEDGDQLVIQGPTGGGKSTLLQMIGGLDRPSAGSVELDGVDLASHQRGQADPAARREDRHHLPGFNLIPTLTAQENVETALVPLGVKPARAARAGRRGAALGRPRRAPQPRCPAELSGGQQQRVAIARALVKKPKVLLADEPTGNLDEGTRDDIMALLEGLWHEYGLTFIMVTHDSSIARRAPAPGHHQGGAAHAHRAGRQEQRPGTATSSRSRG